MSKDLRLDWMAKARSQIGGTNMILARSSVRQDSPGLPVIQILSNRRPAQTNRRIESLPKQPQLVPTCSRRPQSGPRNALKLLQPATDADIHWKLKNQQIILLPIKNYVHTQKLCYVLIVAKLRSSELFDCFNVNVHMTSLSLSLELTGYFTLIIECVWNSYYECLSPHFDCLFIFQ